MSMRSALKASTSPFAHLGRSKAADSDDDDKKKDDAKKARADDDGEDDGNADAKQSKAKKAKSEDGDDADCEDEDGDDDDDDMKSKDKAKSKGKGKAKADDEDDDADDEKKPDARAARARERSRIKAILVSEPGKANPIAAAHLATGTSMPRGQAIEMLAAMQAGQPGAAAESRRDDLRDRMAGVPNPVVGAEGARPAPNLAAQIIAADKKRRGEA